MEISKVIKEVEETITIFEEQKYDLYFIEYGGLLQLKSEKIKLEALKEKVERDNPKPLTWGELKERKNKPIYIVPDTEKPYWAILWFVSDKEIYMRSKKDADDYGLRTLYENTWLAYDYPPKEDL